MAVKHVRRAPAFWGALAARSAIAVIEQAPASTAAAATAKMAMSGRG